MLDELTERTKTEEGWSEKAAAPETDAPETLVCPECGRTFGTLQGLGRHRASHKAKKGKRAKSQGRPSLPLSVAERSFQGDALLRQVYPTGIPPTEDDLNAAVSFLATARELHKRSTPAKKKSKPKR